jgi:hypothetical protein
MLHSLPVSRLGVLFVGSPKPDANETRKEFPAMRRTVPQQTKAKAWVVASWILISVCAFFFKRTFLPGI